MKRLLLLITICISSVSFGQEPIFEWGITIGADDLDGAAGFVADNSGNPIISARFQGLLTLVENGTTLISNPDMDGVIAKFDKLDGTLLWSKQLICSNNGILEITKMQVNSNDDLIIVGSLSEQGGSLDLNPDPSIENVITNMGYSTGFILCLDSLGNYLWSKTIRFEGGSPYWDIGFSNFKILEGDQMLFSVGVSYDGTEPLISPFRFGDDIIDLSYAASISGDMNDYNGFVLVKTDEGGGILFSNIFNEDNLWGNSFLPADFIEYINGDLLVIGSIPQMTDINPDDNFTVIPSDTGTVAAFVKFSSDGDYITSHAFSCLNPDANISSSSYEPISMSISNSENIILNAYYKDTVDIDPLSSGFEYLNAPVYTTVSQLIFDENLLLLNSSIISPLEGIIPGEPGGPQFSSNPFVDTYYNRYFFGGGSSNCDQYFNDSTNLLGNGNTIFIGEQDIQGSLLWSKNLNGRWTSSNGKWMTIDDGNYFITSYSNEIIDLNPDQGINNSLDFGKNIHLIKLSDGTSNLTELNSNQPKELIKIVNLLGQEVEYTPNTVLIYQYSDGTSEKVFTVEN